MGEAGAGKIGFYLASSSVSVVDIMATCGYKFFALVLSVSTSIVTDGGMLYYILFSYFAACAAFSAYCALKQLRTTPVNQQYGGAPTTALHSHIILGLAIAQIPLCWLMTPSQAHKTAV